MQRIIPVSFIKLLFLKDELICAKVLFILKILYKCTFDHYYWKFVNSKSKQAPAQTFIFMSLISPTAIFLIKLSLLIFLHKLLPTLRIFSKDFLSKADLLIITFLSRWLSHFLYLRRSWVSMKIWNSFIHSCKYYNVHMPGTMLDNWDSVSKNKIAKQGKVIGNGLWEGDIWANK